MKLIGRISGSVTDQQKRGAIATFGQVAEGLRASANLFCGLSAAKENFGHDIPSEKLAGASGDQTRRPRFHPLLGEEENQATGSIWENQRRSSGPFWYP
ncbi:hypothetical protein [Bradyrhizobium liaoningense]|uniref:hypothetical protein n=1 Tax=Bradyrhizobium liaoningense TaxID=43992 RepID=UPI001BA77FEA|nr:hypothetical protein [Bradyrhizobium liaoningense]MBR0946862.1 hypothetical protein [Bradyrhizobium liaoningense]